MKHNRSESLGIPPLKTDQGVFVSDKDKAETLNIFFFSVFTNEQLPLPKISTSPYPSPRELLNNYPSIRMLCRVALGNGEQRINSEV